MFRNLFTRIKRKRILKIIKKAKKVYLSGEYNYMCHCFLRVVPSWWDYTDIVKTIPEFKPSTFGIDISSERAWWLYDDRKSRIEAFNKLIKIYSK